MYAAYGTSIADEPCPAPKVYWCYFGSLMEVRRSHTFASWFSRSIKYMSPEISTTIPIPLGICTLSLSLGLQTSMELFLTVRGNAPTCLTDLRNELNPPRGEFVIILLLSSRQLGSNRRVVYDRYRTGNSPCGAIRSASAILTLSINSAGILFRGHLEQVFLILSPEDAGLSIDMLRSECRESISAFRAKSAGWQVPDRSRMAEKAPRNSPPQMIDPTPDLRPT